MAIVLAAVAAPLARHIWHAAAQPSQTGLQAVSAVGVPLVLGILAVACGGGGGPPGAGVAECLLDPSVSPAGDRTLTNWTTREVAIVRRDGVRQAILPPAAPGGEYAYTAPAIMPDGSAVVLGASLRQDGGSFQTGLWLVASNGERRLLLPTDNGKTFDVDAPAVSPDGRRIAFTRVNVTWLDHGHADRFEVWVMNADGSNAAKVADGRAPAWSNDGAYLSFDIQSEAGPDRGRSFLDGQSFMPATGRSLAFCAP